MCIRTYRTRSTIDGRPRAEVVLPREEQPAMGVLLLTSGIMPMVVGLYRLLKEAATLITCVDGFVDNLIDDPELRATR